MITPPMRFDAVPLLWTVPAVYTAVECRRLMTMIEAANPGLATNNPLYRDQDRVMQDDPQMAATLFHRLQCHLPAQINAFKLLKLNERLRFYRYNPGQRFAPHMDHWYQPNDYQISLFTVLVYLNDGFEGGETKFTEQVEHTLRPQQGIAALFQHKIRHEGCPVLRGTKYVMRTDVMYEHP